MSLPPAAMSTKGATKPILVLEDAFVITPKNGEYPYNGLQILGFFLLSFFPLLSMTVIGLRIYSRRLAKGFGMDDWFIFLAMFLALPQAIFTAFVLKSGYWGIPDADIPSGNPPNLGAFWIFINGIVYNPLLALVKVSALLFLLRLGGTKTRVQLACRAMIVFNLMQLLTFFVIAIVQCIPIYSPWVTVPGAKCIRRDVYAVSLAVTNVVTDILTLLIPFLIFLDLKVNKRVRIALMTVFLLGAIVTIVSFVRLYYVIRLYYLIPEDRHHSIGYVCSCVEINLAITTASVPALWPLARRWFPGAFESLGFNRPYLYPDIEVTYATQRSRASRTLRGKVIWQKRRTAPPSSVVVGHNSDGPLVGLSDVREQPVHTASITRGSDGRWRDVDGEDDDASGWTYHDLVRKTASNYEDDDSLASQKLEGTSSQGEDDRGLRTSFQGL